MKNILILCLAAIISQFSFSQDLLWTVITDTNDAYFARDLVLDDEDNIVIGSEGNDAAIILNYDSDGFPNYAVKLDDASFRAMTAGIAGKVYIAGRKENGGHWDAALVAFDSEGNELYTQLQDYSNKDDVFNDVTVDEDNNILLCGSAYNSSSEQCGLIAKYTPDGTPVWIQVYEESGRHISFSSIKISNDGRIYVAGRKSPTSPGTIEMMSVVYTYNGLVLSEYSQSISGYTEAYLRFQLLDEEENQYLGGYCSDNGTIAAFLMKLTDNNNFNWLYVGETGTSFLQGTQASDDKIICCGESVNSSTDAYVVSFNRQGGLEKELSYDSPYQLEDLFYDVVESSDYIYLCGSSEGLGTQNDMLALKLDMDLENMWVIRYNGFNNALEAATRMAVDSEGNIVICGSSISTSGFYLAAWKYSNPLEIEEVNPDLKMLNIYPNPVHDKIMIHMGAWQNNPVQIMISDINGKQLIEHSYSITKETLQIDVSTLAPGTYLIHLNSSDIMQSRKFVKK